MGDMTVGTDACKTGVSNVRPGGHLSPLKCFCLAEWRKFMTS